jgi:hypothetical protein
MIAVGMEAPKIETTQYDYCFDYRATFVIASEAKQSSAPP